MDYRPSYKLVFLNETMNTASVATTSTIFASSIIPPLASGLTGMLWVQYSPVTTGTLQAVYSTANSSTVLTRSYAGRSSLITLASGTLANYYIPIANKNPINFRPGTNGTSVNILSVWFIE